MYGEENMNVDNFSYETIKDNLSTLSMYISIGVITLSDSEGSINKALKGINAKLESYTNNGNK